MSSNYPKIDDPYNQKPHHQTENLDQNDDIGSGVINIKI